MYNASVEVVRESAQARVIRVLPDRPKRRYQGGQYGSLGLASVSDPARLVKRAYSVSSPVLDLEGRTLIEPDEQEWLEFYFNRVTPAPGREALTPLLFGLKTGDRVWCGEKITGHYTLEKAPPERDVLLVATTTGEAANNSLLSQFLREGRPGAVCSVLLGPEGWESLYRDEHEALRRTTPRYRFLTLSGPDAASRFAGLLGGALADPQVARREFGFALEPGRTHFFLVGDPAMIGAPEKLGAWAYEQRSGGLLALLEGRGFAAGTRFKQGDIEHESYW